MSRPPTTAVIGACRFGPVDGPAELVTSYDDFRRLFGGTDELRFGEMRCARHLGHAARTFFESGGQRLLVARTFRPKADDPSGGVARSDVLFEGPAAPLDARASVPVVLPFRGVVRARFYARFPGTDGNLPVRVRAGRGPNVLVSGRLFGLRNGDVVEIGDAPRPRDVWQWIPPERESLPRDIRQSPLRDIARSLASRLGELCHVRFDDNGFPYLEDTHGRTVELHRVGAVQRVTLTVDIGRRGGRVDTYSGLSTHPRSASYIGTVLRKDGPLDRHARIYFGFEAPGGRPAAPAALAPEAFADLFRALVDRSPAMLAGGDDGAPLTAADHRTNRLPPEAHLIEKDPSR